MPDNLYNLNIHQLNLLLYRCLYLLHNPIGFLYILSFFLCRNRLDDSAKVVKAPKTKNGVKDKAANENLLPSTKSLNNKSNWASCHLFFKRFNRRSKSLHTGTYRTGVHFHST